jgi:hypothetical protein
LSDSVLDEYAEEAQGRPMLSALVVGVSGKPGAGFFDLARQLGRLQSEKEEDEQRFWEEEKEALYVILVGTFELARRLFGAELPALLEEMNEALTV